MIYGQEVGEELEMEAMVERAEGKQVTIHFTSTTLYLTLTILFRKLWSWTPRFIRGERR